VVDCTPVVDAPVACADLLARAPEKIMEFDFVPFYEPSGCAFNSSLIFLRDLPNY
jgi:hypothetical protein